MKVLKFGGTSVHGSERIKNLINLVQREKSENQNLVVIVSAFSKVTDELLKLSRYACRKDEKYLEVIGELKNTHYKAIYELFADNASLKESTLKKINNLFMELEEVVRGVYLLGELTNQSSDRVICYGEMFSATIISEYAKFVGVNAQFIDARNYIITDNSFGSARVDLKRTYSNIKNLHSINNSVFVVTGFIASTHEGATTTLGRGGSDYTAAIWAGAITASELQIWTDVDGVMSADPRRVKKAIPMKAISYDEAMELSNSGAKVIYPPTIKPALEKKIPIRVLNSFNPEFKGTLIWDKTSDERGIKGISSMAGITLIRVQGSGMVGVSGFASRMFTCLANAKINIILITQASSEHSICVAIKKDDTVAAKDALSSEFEREIKNYALDEVIIENDLSIIAVVGENMRKTPGISGKIFGTLGKSGVNVIAIAQGSSELNISIVIPASDESKALTAVHDAFFLSDAKTINLFVIGIGTVGSTLLKQIKEQKDYCYKELHLDFKLTGIANSKFMNFNEDGIDFGDYKNTILSATDSNKKMELQKYVDAMVAMNLPNSIFVDNTASYDVAELYPQILTASISIVTPNKVANTKKYEFYKELKVLQKKHHAKFFYETNVGAGLPVIGTLENLINSGEKILSIEAVLSGTMSFIFNEFMKGGKLSDIVREAKAKGYSEPDPRIDLSGLDIARKILILARDSGYKLELEDVLVDKIIPEKCFDVKTVDEFFVELDKQNDYFDKLREEVIRSGKALRYVAVFEAGKARVYLTHVDSNHPAYALKGSENLILFKTENYKDYPLVVKGPGAGAEVTAGGVFADIIRLANINL